MFEVMISGAKASVNGIRCKRVTGKSGGHRRIWINKELGVVLKADFDTRHEYCHFDRQTEMEVRFFTEDLEDEDRAYFPRMLAHGTYGKGHAWILESLEPLQDGNTSLEEPDYTVLDLQEKYSLWDVSPYESGPRGNWAFRTNGVPCIFDCGA